MLPVLNASCQALLLVTETSFVYTRTCAKPQNQYNKTMHKTRTESQTHKSQTKGFDSKDRIKETLQEENWRNFPSSHVGTVHRDIH